jgi:hypothetical protein
MLRRTICTCSAVKDARAARTGPQYGRPGPLHQELPHSFALNLSKIAAHRPACIAARAGSVYNLFCPPDKSTEILNKSGSWATSDIVFRAGDPDSGQCLAQKSEN